MHSKYKYLVFVIAIMFTACKTKVSIQNTAPPPVYVSMTTVKDTLASSYEEYPATVAALNEVKLTPQVSGYITGIYFKDGAKVSKGEKLYTIDQQVYGANLQQAIANLDVQQTNLVKTQKDADRYHELEKHDAIAKQQVDYADAALDAAKKQVAAAQANVNAVRANVRFAEITAPFSGTIGISQVKPGTAVVAGQTILNTVSTDDPIAVDINVNQSDIFRFLKLQQQEQTRFDSTFTLYFGNDRYDYNGKIYLIDRAVDPQTGTIKARLVFPNPQRILKPGMNATVRLATNNSAPSILIPFKAVTEQLGEYFTYVIGDSSKVKQQKVELGPQIGSNVVIKSGLKAGDKIVVEGVQNLHQGTVITTTPLQPQAQKK
jgi:membrane fusion protein (multidrug efflux system)